MIVRVICSAAQTTFTNRSNDTNHEDFEPLQHSQVYATGSDDRILSGIYRVRELLIIMDIIILSQLRRRCTAHPKASTQMI